MQEVLEMSALYATLEQAPGDVVTLMALADWHEERGESRAAECFRWLAAKRKAPYRYRHKAAGLRHSHDTWHDGWFWWATARERKGWGYPRACVLPHAVWNPLAHSFKYDPLVFKEYPTVRAAVEALIAGWIRPAERPRRPMA